MFYSPTIRFIRHSDFLSRYFLVLAQVGCLYCTEFGKIYVARVLIDVQDGTYHRYLVMLIYIDI